MLSQGGASLAAVLQIEAYLVLVNFHSHIAVDDKQIVFMNNYFVAKNREFFGGNNFPGWIEYQELEPV